MLRFIAPAAFLFACVPEGIRYPNPTDAGPTTDAEPIEEDAGAPDALPEDGGPPPGRLSVTANGAVVEQGATYDFGPIVSGDTRTVSFAIENGTAAAVSLIGSPSIALSGAGAASFTVVQPASASIPAGGSAEFSIAASPSAIATVSAGVDIAHDGGTYTFGVAATGRPPGIWVGVGANGRRSVSVDGITWSNEQTFAGSEDSNLFRGLGHGAGVFVAVGGGPNGLLYWSDNGIDWNDVSDSMGWFGGVAYGNDMFLAVGANGRFLVSNDGRSWGTGDVDFQQHFRSVAFGNGEFVLVGEEGRRASTTDGSSFTSNITGGDRLTSIVFTGDRFVAVGLNGRRVVSLDGETWMFDTTASDGLGFFDVAFGEGVVVAVGGVGTVISTDGGETWTQDRNAPLMNALSYGNGIFVGTGDFEGVSFTSDDGLSWTRHDDVGPAGFNRIVYGE